MIEEDLRQKKQLAFDFLVKSSEDLTAMTISRLPRLSNSLTSPHGKNEARMNPTF